MRIAQKITPRQITRVKWMSLIALVSIATQFLTSYVADAAIEGQDYEGPYLWDGTEYDMYVRVQNPQGFIDEFTNKDEFCTSWVYHPGLSLMNDGVLAICYLLFLFWLFIGISILADIFMEAIEQITSKSELVNILDAEGNNVAVEKMFWNPTIANLTLMALGSSAPEIILSVADTMGTLGDLPSELGPQAIVGSAAFNLLVISAVSIMAVTEPKKINMVGVFATTAIFSTFAYIWFFLVLVVISPGYVELWEACVTVGYMAALCIIAYGCDIKHSTGESVDEKKVADRRATAKGGIRMMQKRFGMRVMIDTAQGNQPELPKDQSMSEIEKDNILNYFRVLLSTHITKVEDFDDEDNLTNPKDVTINDLLDCLSAENAVERIAYRKEVAGSAKKDFLRINKGEMGQIHKEKDDSINHSKTVCFKHSRYEVSESNGHVEITIQKKIEGEFTFWLKTFDGTAKAVEDYVEKNELMMMQADEWERQIKIEIKDDTNWEPDEVFTVQLLDEVTNKRLDGDDTKCEVMIIDEDKPGNLGFPKTNKKVRRKDKDVYIKIHRQNGSDGEISCLVRTVVDENVPGVKAIENKDFVPIKDQKLTFKMGEVEHTLKIEMPDCESVKDDDGEEVEADHIDTVSFAIMLHSPSPEGIKLSKRQVCYINIEADDDEAEKIAKQRHRQMLDYFMSEKTITWGQQFKIACELGPQIDSDDLIVEDVGCASALWHFLSMFWKVVGAIVPPRHIWGGWASFLVALLIIGIVTTIVGEVATVLGCVINLKPSVTGITLVAMGTSLPDTFASMQAARSSKHADSAIGNVTGSNSVNVFLGMGLPWLIASIYWHVNYSVDYAVPPGSMSFSVIMFLICSMVCFLVLVLRRVCLEAELGGEGLARPLSAFILFSLWLIYVIAVSLESYEVVTVNIGDVPSTDDYDLPV